MTTAGNSEPSEKSIARSLSLAALSGMAAGLVAAAMDTTQAADELDATSSVALLLLQTSGRLCFATGLLAAVIAAISAAGGSLSRRFGKPPDVGAAGLLAALSVPGAVYVSIRLFQGGVTSQLPARPALIAACAVLLTVIAWILARLALWVVRGEDGPRPRARALLVAAVLVAVALFARWCDANLYKRLYLYLHACLALATLGPLALAFRLTVFGNERRPGVVRFALVAGAAAALLAAAALFTAQARQTVKVAMYDGTATTANLLLLTTGPRVVGDDPRPSEEARRMRYELERKAKLAATADSLPVLPKAHLILITIDALRADKLGAYGYTARALSPNIDRFAASATVFERAYCTAPHSSFSISSFHTSRYLHDEAMLGRDLAHPTIASVLGAAGYETSAFYTQGIFFTEGDKVSTYKSSRFDFETVSHGAPPPDVLTDNAIAEIDRMVARGEPAFFLWVHYFNVHEPYQSTVFGTAPVDRYEGEIARADREVGRLLEYIDATLARDAVIVLGADHGEEFKEHGGYYHGSSLFEEQVRVPLIIKAPGAEPRRISAPVSLVDIAPTALGMLGIRAPEGMEGQDLRPAIYGGQEAHVARPVFASVMHRHMMLKWPWKLVSDPSRGLYELYDLTRDPGEHINRYDLENALAAGLLDEMNAWLDDIAKGDDPARTALNMGRMRDKRAVPGLLAVAQNTGAPAQDRVAALGLLAQIRAWGQEKRLADLLDDGDDRVATHAALALAALNDKAGVPILQDALYDDDPEIRDHAALALGGLKERSAVPALIEALGRDDLKVREEAIRLLGDLGDPRATEPLIDTIPEDRTRYLTVLALGKIGDARAFDSLMEVLAHETHTDIRGYVVVALGWMENRAATDTLMRVLVEEPEHKWTPEALVRLGAIEQGLLAGTDLHQGATAKTRGWGECYRKARVLPEEFLDRTACATTGKAAELTLETNIDGEAIAILRARHLLDDPAAGATLSVSVDGAKIAAISLLPTFEEHRIRVGTGVFGAGRHVVELSLDADGKFEVDHFLIVGDR